MLRPIVLMLAAAAVAACGPKGQQAGQGTADSTAMSTPLADSTGARDSVGAAPSTAPAVRDSTAPKSAGKAPRAEPYIGYDSAFGPSFTVDSTGKITPIVPAKKKP